MVSVYVKALVITLVLFAGNYFFVKYLDDSRAQDLQTRVSDLEEEMQSARTLLLYTQTYNRSTEICPALEETTRAQINKLYDLFSQLQQTESSAVLADTARTKRRFILANSELWLYLRQLESVCGSSGITPILYFYPDQRDCVECRAQAQILNSVRDACSNVRVFAFPTDLDLGVVNAIKSRYSITTTPSIVINEKTLAGITSRDAILSEVACIKN
ncbi:hypothetical protein J4220_01145 [Candidatus Micrarchaeota archaeon]|nr:hypothetical protein [Candidatus Micrarchaeota archaeon]